MYKTICYAAAFLASVSSAKKGKKKHSRFSIDGVERTWPTYSPSLSEIEAVAATSVADHTSSDVQGSAFNRFVVIYLENTDYDAAAADPNLSWLTQFGVTLDNYWSLTHPSEPNYVGSVGGDFWGLGDDTFIQLPVNVSTVVDLLDSKGISWGEYQEHIPYAGYQGYNFSNQVTYANDYGRSHNPLISYLSVTEDPSRLAKIKSFVDFNNDLASQELPQWMFITPNKTNDGHDTTITVAGQWTRNFLEPLLSNEYFMKDTLVMVTFDENETYPTQNKIWTLLLGGAVPESLHGTTDSTFYDHYSELSTVEANWNLNSLGRNDATANVIDFVAKLTGVTNDVIDTTNLYNNQSSNGYVSDNTLPLPAPNVCIMNKNGQPVLPAIVSVWSAAMVEEYGTTCNVSTTMSSTTMAITSTIVTSATSAVLSTSGSVMSTGTAAPANTLMSSVPQSTGSQGFTQAAAAQNSTELTTINEMNTATITSCPTTTSVMISTNANGEVVTMTVLADSTTTVTICTRCEEGIQSVEPAQSSQSTQSAQSAQTAKPVTIQSVFSTSTAKPSSIAVFSEGVGANLKPIAGAFGLLAAVYGFFI